MSRKALLLALLALLAAPAVRATVISSGLVATTTSMSESVVYQSASVSTQRVDVARTRILARDVRDAVVYDQTFDLPFADAAVQAAVTAARQAIGSASAPQ